MSGGAVIVVAHGPLGPRDRYRPWLAPGARVVAADGGAHNALALGLQPDWVVGDLDSLSAVAGTRLLEAGVPFRQLPRAKDWTDLEVALEVALSLAPSRLVLVAGLGGRLDHTLTNLQFLPGLARRGLDPVALGPAGIVRVAVAGRPVGVEARHGRLVSLVPLTGRVTGVRATGFRWPLEGASLAWGRSLGVSNELVAAGGQVEVGRGALLVIQPWPGGEGETEVAWAEEETAVPSELDPVPAPVNAEE